MSSAERQRFEDTMPVGAMPRPSTYLMGGCGVADGWPVGCCGWLVGGWAGGAWVAGRWVDSPTPLALNYISHI